MLRRSHSTLTETALVSSSLVGGPPSPGVVMRAICLLTSLPFPPSKGGSGGGIPFVPSCLRASVPACLLHTTTCSRSHRDGAQRKNVLVDTNRLLRATLHSTIPRLPPVTSWLRCFVAPWLGTLNRQSQIANRKSKMVYSSSGPMAGPKAMR
jgi:hypothetical protein